MGRLFLFTVVCFLGCNTDSQDFSGSTYDEHISDWQKKGILNGNILIAQNGNVVHRSAFGLSNIEPSDSLKLDAQFRLASLSKQFTAMGILTLSTSGVLAIDDSLSQYIPELPYSGITIRHLLNHTSGLPDYEALFLNNWKPDLPVQDRNRFVSGNDDVIKLLVEYKPEISFLPGEKWEYSNTGYVLLATVIVRASGIPFPDYLAAKVFQPAGMTETLVFNPLEESPMAHRVFGLKQEENEIRYHDVHFLNPVQGDGGIYSTLEDLYAWNQFLYENTLIPDSLLQASYTPGILNNGESTDYGFGWSIGKSKAGTNIVKHSGGWVGFSTYIYRDLEKHNTIIILTNNSSGEVRKILNDLLEIMYN